MPMDLHVECRRRLRETLETALPQLQFHNGRYLELASVRSLQAASEVLPSRHRKLANEWVSNNPVSHFVYGVLSERLFSSYEYDSSDELRNLVELPEFSDGPLLAESLLEEFLSLPCRYTFFLPLFRADKFGEGCFPDEGFSISPSLALVDG